MAAWGATGVLGRAGAGRRSRRGAPARSAAGRWRSSAAPPGSRSRSSRTSATGSPTATTARAARGLRRQGARLRRRPRRGLPGVRARLRPGADPLDRALRPAPAGDAGSTPGAAPLPVRRRPLLALALRLAGLRPRRRRRRGRPDARGRATCCGAENADGGFGAAPGQPSAALYTGWAALGLAAAGHDPQRGRAAGRQRDRLRRARSRARSRRRLARAHDPRRPAPPACRRAASAATTSSPRCERDIRARRLGRRPGQPDRVRGPRPAGRRASRPPARTLALADAPAGPRRRLQLRQRGRQQRRRRHRRRARGAGRAPGARGGRARRAPCAYLRRQQNRDGGFPAQPGGRSNAQSTAWAIQGLIAAGVDPGVAASRRRAVAAGLPALADRRRRPASATRAAPTRPRCG